MDIYLERDKNGLKFLILFVVVLKKEGFNRFSIRTFFNLSCNLFAITPKSVGYILFFGNDHVSSCLFLFRTMCLYYVKSLTLASTSIQYTMEWILKCLLPNISLVLAIVLIKTLLNKGILHRPDLTTPD